MRGSFASCLKPLAALSALSLAAAAWAAPAKIGMLEIKDAPGTAPSPMAWLSGEEKPTLLTLVNAIEGVAKRSDLSGIMIRLKDAALSQTDVQELGEAIKKAQAAGKKVHIFSESYGQTYLARAAYAD